MDKTAKFCCEMLQNAENIAMPISQVLYVFVLWAGKPPVIFCDGSSFLYHIHSYNYNHIYCIHYIHTYSYNYNYNFFL